MTDPCVVSMRSVHDPFSFFVMCVCLLVCILFAALGGGLFRLRILVFAGLRG